MAPLQLSGGIIGLMAYFLLFFLIVADRKQNFTAWFLATVIDFFVFYLTFPNGNWPLPLAYTIGSLLISFALLFKKRFSFDWKWDFWIICAVIVCLVFWRTSETRELAIVSFVLASVMSFAPQIRETAKDSDGETVLFITYFIFLVGDILSYSGREDNSTEEMAYSFAEIILSLIMLTVIWFNISATKKKKETLR